MAEPVARRSSVKNVFLKISQDSQENMYMVHVSVPVSGHKKSLVYTAEYGTKLVKVLKIK